MGAGTPSARLVVKGGDARAVARAVVEVRGRGLAAVGFVGDDEDLARQMAEEMLGGVDEVVGEGEWPEGRGQR